MKVLVTGANGFVGSAFMARLAAMSDIEAVGAVRGARRPDAAEGLSAAAKWVQAPAELSAEADWAAALQDADVVVHTAARVHVMREASADPLQEYRRVNVEGSLRLARQAVAAGVRRFVFLSSVKVHGESTAPGRPFRADDSPAPVDAYGRSKWEAEQGLWRIARESGMELVVIRPPLVYGPGVKANFAALLGAVRRGWPLPLGAIDNRRSYVGLGNLTDFMAACVTHAAAANQTFLVSDGVDVSTPDLVRAMARAVGVRPRLLPVPVGLLSWCASLAGRTAMVERLSGNLQLDITWSRERLGWTPPQSLADGLRVLVAQGSNS